MIDETTTTETQQTTTETQAADTTAAETVTETAAPTDPLLLLEKTVYKDGMEFAPNAMAGLSESVIKSWPDETRLAFAALIKRQKDAEAALATEKAEIAKQREAAAAEAAAREAEIQRKQLAYSKAVADPAVIDKLREQIAKKPQVLNPVDPENLAAYIEATAAQKLMDSMGPAAANHDRLHRQEASRQILQQAGLDHQNTADRQAVQAKMRDIYGRPDMAPADFTAHIAKLADAARTAGTKPPLAVAAGLVAAERAAKAAAAARADETAARIAGARSLSAPTPTQPLAEKTDEEIYKAVYAEAQKDPAAFSRAWKDPKIRAAIERYNAVN